jgi:predicted metal-binding membrane protein
LSSAVSAARRSPSSGADTRLGGGAAIGLPWRERVLIGAVLAALALLSWLYLYAQMQPMAEMAEMAPAAFAPWGAADFALNFAFWWAMMPGMMLPSAAPMILTFAAVNRRKRERGQPYVPTAVFTAGYLAAWGLFGAAATLADWGLERAALIAPQTQALGPLLAAVVVGAAGLYQLTPLKSVCLAHCRSPLDFVLNHWREGAAGALRMGVEHGFYCLGCCWFLMGLMFAAGIMSLLWMAAIAAFVLVEKLVPAGLWLTRAAGLAMLGFALYQLTRL